MWYEVLPRWKYRVTKAQSYYIPELSRFRCQIRSRGGILLAELDYGWLHLYPGYAWDGASGPAIDTETFMLPSALHDALYQMIREELLTPRRKMRRIADAVIRRASKLTGMSWIRRWVDWSGLRLFGWKAV